MRWVRRCVNALLGTVAVVLVVLAAMALQALRAPGADNAEAKLAEWGRDHGLATQVTWLERLKWGDTIGQAAFIQRSGFGVTATGAEVYVGGPALSVCSLGRILADAGVVHGMELDINPTWVSGAYFHDQSTGPPTGFKLFPDEQVDPLHYLQTSSRDWLAWFVRT